ncbi:MAG: hypothetical protein LBH25_05320 [Fibromonadaceae bacterium]|jgi:hypothetical protein|nr:hypothetical protein [Fibromonadaceae bacterium]
MKKCNFLAIGILTVVFFLGCSDSSSGSGKPSLTASNAENFQVYMEDDCPGDCSFSPFAGNGVIRIGVYELDSEGKDFKDFIPFGAVKNGKGTLDFSVEIPLIYLESDDFPSSMSISLKSAKVFAVDELYLISGSSAYRLKQYYEYKTKYEYVIYTYATQAATEPDLDISQGWNAIYASATRNSVKMSTDPSTVNFGSMKWHASYRGSATFFGGPDTASIDYYYCDIGPSCFSIQELSEEFGYAVSCEVAFGGHGIPVHSCPETIDGYCTRAEGWCSPSNDKKCNYWGGIFNPVKPPDCEWD